MNVGRLGLPYQEQEEIDFDPRPANARECRALVINGLPGECAHYAQLGWKATPIVFAPGLAQLYSQQGTPFLAASWHAAIPGDGSQFDAAICGMSAGLVQDWGVLCAKISPLLKPGAKLWLKIESASYHQTLCAKAGREIFPWPGTPLTGASWLQKEWKTPGFFGPFQVEEEREVLDTLFHNPKQSQWRTVEGWDCRIHLSANGAERKENFVQCWWLRLSDTSASVVSSAAPLLDRDKLHEDISSLLENGRMEEAGILVDKIHRAGLTNAATWNLQGIHQYYQNKFDDAFSSFRMSCQLDGSKEDPHQNLLDCALRCGRIEEATAIVRQNGKNYPNLLRLLHAS